MQFSYRPHKEVKDATVTWFKLLVKHLDGNGSRARLQFVDFHSAFNTIQPYVLTSGLLELFDLSINLVGRSFDFLTDRKQKERINLILSQFGPQIGSPRGCVLLLQSSVIDRNMCQSRCKNRILKYADS